MAEDEGRASGRGEGRARETATTKIDGPRTFPRGRARMLEENDHKNLLKAYKLFVNYKDDDEILGKINVNTLVTTGQNDLGSTAEMAKNLIEKIKGAKYVEIKKGKHLCNIECAEDFNKAIESFVDRNYDEA